jgi:hypothetical protein
MWIVVLVATVVAAMVLRRPAELHYAVWRSASPRCRCGAGRPRAHHPFVLIL